MGKRSTLVACLLLALVLGGLREFLFVNLNYQLDHVARRTEFSFAHSIFQRWTNDWSLGDLTVLKWTMACASTASMCLLCVWLARALFAPRRFDKWILLAYGAIGLFAFLLHLSARWFAPPLEVVSVKLLHALQYPVVLIFLWAASNLDRRRTASSP